MDVINVLFFIISIMGLVVTYAGLLSMGVDGIQLVIALLVVTMGIFLAKDELDAYRTAKAEPVITNCGAIESAEHHKGLMPVLGYYLLVTENCPTVHVSSYKNDLNLRVGQETRLEARQLGRSSHMERQVCQDDNCAVVMK